MPIDPAFKKQIEDDIIAAMSPHITIMEHGETAVVFDSVVAHARQQNLDELLKDDSNKIIITMDYSNTDQPFIRTCSDYMGEKRVPYLIGSFEDYVSDANIIAPAVFNYPITLTERRIQRMALYVARPVGSTATMRLQIKDEFGKVIWARIFYAGEIGSNLHHWMEFSVGITAPSLNITLTFDEFPVGDDDPPLGILLGIDDSNNPCVRFYACTVGKYIGKINLSTVRFQIIAKNKKKGVAPRPDLYIGSCDLILQTSQKLREHIWANWNQYGLNDVRPVTLPANTPEIYYWEYLFFDVALVTRDIGGEPQQKYTLNELDIKVSQR